MIRIGVMDSEREYVNKLARYLQKYSSGKWVVSGFTNYQDLIHYTEHKKLDVLVGTNQEILMNVSKGKDEIRLWLKSVPCNLEEIENQFYVAYRFQSALEIGKCIDKITKDYEKSTTEEITCVAMYSPVGRCGKTTLAIEITKEAMQGRWVYFGLEDYNTFVRSMDEKAYVADELLYYWKERKGDNVLQLIEDAGGFIPSGSCFLDGKYVSTEDIRWIKKLFAKSKYVGLLFDIGSGVLQSLYLLQEFDVVMVPYVKEQNALAKKYCFEKLLEQHGLQEEMKQIWFVDMDNKNEWNSVKNKLLGGETI